MVAGVVCRMVTTGECHVIKSMPVNQTCRHSFQNYFYFTFQLTKTSSASVLTSVGVDGHNTRHDTCLFTRLSSPARHINNSSGAPIICKANDHKQTDECICHSQKKKDNLQPPASILGTTPTDRWKRPRRFFQAWWRTFWEMQEITKEPADTLVIDFDTSTAALFLLSGHYSAWRSAGCDSLHSYLNSPVYTWIIWFVS